MDAHRKDVERWDWNDPAPVPPDYIRNILCTHPAFSAAHRQSVFGALAFADAHPRFQEQVPDIGTLFLCCAALYMDCSGGLTHRRLREMMGRSTLLSAGRASAILWRLRLGKLIEPDPGGGRSFVPTTSMRDGLLGRFALDLGPIALLEPGFAPVAERFDERDVSCAYVCAMAEDIIRNLDPQPYAELNPFYELAGRNNAILILYALLEGVPADGNFPPVGESAVTVSSLARRFNLSRSHVLRVLRHMEELGLIETREAARYLTPALADTLRFFQGVSFCTYLRAAAKALPVAQGAPGGCAHPMDAP